MRKMYAVIAFILLLMRVWPVVAGLTNSGEIKHTYDFPHLTLPSSITYKDLRRAVSPSPNRSLLTAIHSINFGVVPLKTQKSRFITVQNPTSVPIVAQVVLLPTNFEEVVSAGCPRKGEIVLDEDEFDSRGDWDGRCASDDLEVPSIDELSKKDPPLSLKFSKKLGLLDSIRQHFLYREIQASEKPKQSSKLSLLPRYKCGKRCSWSLPDTEINAFMLQKQSQGFFLGAKAREKVAIAPGESVSIGPILFQPGAVGAYEGKVLVRTTAGLSHIIDLRGEGQYARLSFRKETTHRYPAQRLTIQSQELQFLSFDITAEDIEPIAVLHSNSLRLPEQIRITKVFEAENVGTIPLMVTNVLLNGGVCSLMGVTVENCEETRVVRPKETMEVVVSYEVSFWQKGVELQLWVVAEEDTFYLPLEVSLHLEDLARFSSLQLTPRHSSLFHLSELCTLVHLFCTVGYLIVVFHEVTKKGPKLPSARLISTRRFASRKGYFVYTRLQAPILHAQPQSAPIEKEEEVQVSVSPGTEDSTPQLEDSMKVKRIKKNKGPILKFSPVKFDTQKDASAQSQSVFATNKLLLAKKKPKVSEAQEITEGEKPGLKESLMLESRTTAAHSEDGEMEEEIDEYLDDYKTREGLFNGFSTRMGS